MFTHRATLFVAAALAVAAFATSGCGTDDRASLPGNDYVPGATGYTTPDSSNTSNSGSSNTSTAEPTAARQPAGPQLPQGSVPREVVGTWSGGAGSDSKEYLRIGPAGEYRRWTAGSQQPFEAGVIVTYNYSFTFYDTRGEKQLARWGRDNSTGIEFLYLLFERDGEYSFVRVS